MDCRIFFIACVCLFDLRSYFLDKMTKLFYCIRNKDSADDYVSALNKAGYSETRKLDRADFLLFDVEHKGRLSLSSKFREKKPSFIYPHTPYSFWLWDGVYQQTKVCCNFVVGETAKRGMELYGYSSRVEVVGFTGCQVREFHPTKGTTLLFAPPHLLGSGKYTNAAIHHSIRRAASVIVKNIKYFDKVIVSHSWQGIKESECGEFIGYDNVEFYPVNAYRTKGCRRHAVGQIARADLVVAQNTLSYLSVAVGMPTIMFGNDFRWDRIKNYHLYEDIYKFPLNLEKMTIDEILAVRERRNEDVERWKEMNIGTQFDAEKFISVIREYV